MIAVTPLRLIKQGRSEKGFQGEHQEEVVVKKANLAENGEKRGEAPLVPLLVLRRFRLLELRCSGLFHVSCFDSAS